MAFLDLLLLVLAILISGYWQFSFWVWLPLLAVILVLTSITSGLGLGWLILFWLIFAIAAVFVLAQQLRRRFFSRLIFKFLQKRMPTISTTEREAIEAGDTWWEKDLFCGEPDWKKLFEYPKPTLSKDEQSFLGNQVETLCLMLDDWQIVKDKEMPKTVWDFLKQEKFFGLVIDKKYGGLGFSALAHSTIVMKIATRSASAAVNMMVPNSLGPAELLSHYGTEEQKNYYLPRLARGEEIPCFALTGPEAGSDASSIPDKGVVCRGQYQGQEVLGINLTWDKRYITLAPIATLLGLAFHLYDPDHLLGSQKDVGITLCLIPTSHPGVEIGHRHLPMNLAFVNGPTRGKDVFIPLDFIIGGKNMAGRGWRCLMECLSIGRSISLPALSTAAAKLSYRVTGAYARLRKQFHTSISNFEGIEEALAEIGGLTYLLEATRLMTATAVDQHRRPAIASAIAKCHMTEMARQIINHAMDIHAGHMIQVGPSNCLAHAYMAAPISITVEGANILTRNLIIFGQGAIRCHPFLLREIKLLQEEDAETLAKFDKILLQHLGYYTRNKTRTFVMGLTGGMLVHAPVSGATAKYYRQLTRMSSALAFLTDISLVVLGGNLKRKENMSARLGDVLSYLYLGSATLKYFQDNGQPATDLSSVQWVLETCLAKIQQAIDEFTQNFPSRVLGTILRWVIFPWGRAYKKPRDKLSQKIAAVMSEPSEFRDRVTRHCFVKKDPKDAVGRIELAFEKMEHADAASKKLQHAIKEKVISRRTSFKEQIENALKVGVLTGEEANRLREFEAFRLAALKVDEFTFDLRSIVH